MKNALENSFDVVVVGGGHAGCEAALAAVRAGARVALLTQSLADLGRMSCNPAVGGIGKSHLVKEVDALGGMMALATDRAGIQFRRLNASRGAAVQATRAQCDRELYRAAVHGVMRAAEAADSEGGGRLTMVETTVDDLCVRGGKVEGVRGGGGEGRRFAAAAVVLTVGTFLNGMMHVGARKTAGGRAGSAAASALAARLAELNLPRGRLKTGTPARLAKDSIDFSGLEAQYGDSPRPVMSFLGESDWHPRQVPCYVSATTARTHEIIRRHLHESPMFSGEIGGVGPRYCPSVEDKVSRFPERESHRVFLEPEGLACGLVYPNGISTSLPPAVQEAFIATIPGLERARIVQYGYAIEYDYFDPRALTPSLETRALRGLYFAGQINGTTGYEEAAAQGVVAGVNAARAVRGLAPWTPARDEAYAGVMIDDLTARGVTEPYRMFTSRAECRLTLREDNADLRLTEIGRRLGLVDEARYARFAARRERLAVEEARLEEVRADEVWEGAPAGTSAARYLRRSEARYADLGEAAVLRAAADVGEIEARIKYAGYIAHQQTRLEQARAEETWEIPADFDFAAVSGLSNEVRELLTRHHPATLRQARRIGGVTPAAVALLSACLKRRAGRAA